MKLRFEEAQTPYQSGAQSARVWTEQWAATELYCPGCGSRPLIGYENNRPVADLHCGVCAEEFELKSSKRSFGKKVVDGAYSAMSERLSSGSNPSLLLLAYDRNRLAVKNLIVVPKHFFTMGIIEKRKPLGPNARRAGWVGCNILYDRVPKAGRIPIVEDGHPLPQDEVISRWRRSLFLADKNEASRGWLVNVMRCVDALERQEFTTDDAYGFAGELQAIYPNNRHVKEKIRQQLQVLRDNGWLEFVSRGRYRIVGR